MVIKFFAAAIAACAVVGSAQAELTWDGTVDVPAFSYGSPGEYLVCPRGAYLPAKRGKCLRGVALPESVGEPKRMSL